MLEYPNDSVSLVPAKGDAAGHVMSDQEKWLIYCPAIANDTLLYYIKQGDSCSLRSYGGRLGVNATRRHAQGASTTAEFEHLFKPDLVREMSYLELAVSNTKQWAMRVDEYWADYRAKKGF